jgi:hypothetical protein
MNEDEDKVKVLEFVLFCVEMYAQKHEISGRVVMDRFSEYGVVDFLRDGYDVLHTQGREYIISEIEIFLDNRGLAI